MNKLKLIKELKEEIEYEQMQYDVACEHPTETAQFYSALERSRIRLNEMKEKLVELLPSKPIHGAESACPIESCPQCEKECNKY